MKISNICSMVALVLISSVMAQAGVRVPVVLADVVVPEPSTAIVGAGALLVVLGLARRRKQQ